MYTKRSLITGLVGFNLLLLILLVLSSYSSPSVLAQGGGNRGSFITVTAKASGQSYDVLYVLDVSSRKLHALYPSSARSRKYLHTPYRDLVSDFGRN